MKLYRAKNYEELSKIAANIMAAQITLKPDSVIGLATGSTPIGMYDNLVAKNQAGDLDFSQVTTVNLDEYKGLPASHDQSYSYFMHSHLFDKETELTILDGEGTKAYVPVVELERQEQARKEAAENPNAGAKGNFFSKLLKKKAKDEPADDNK